MYTLIVRLLYSLIFYSFNREKYKSLRNWSIIFYFYVINIYFILHYNSYLLSRNSSRKTKLVKKLLICLLWNEHIHIYTYLIRVIISLLMLYYKSEPSLKLLTFFAEIFPFLQYFFLIIYSKIDKSATTEFNTNRTQIKTYNAIYSY